MPGSPPGWYPAPSPGDIVWCRFPERGLPRPGPKPRPGLVVKVGETPEGPTAWVGYGTSKKVDQLFAGEFSISPTEGAAFEVAGLTTATKFDLSRLLELDFNDIWFAVPPGSPFGQIPKLGILHPSLVRRAQAAYNAARRH